MPVTSRAYLGPEVGRGHIGRRADRLGDDGGHVPLVREHIFDVVGALEIATAARCALPQAAILARRGHVRSAGEQRAHASTKDLFAADRDGVERRAVKRIPHRDRLVSPGGDPRELERHADRRRAAGAEERLVEMARRELGQSSREIDRHAVRVAARAEGQLVELRLHGGDHRRIAVAHLVYVVAVKIHVAPTLQVLDVDPLGVLKRVEAGGREGLVQEPTRIVGQ
jgi:hypothetical protein